MTPQETIAYYDQPDNAAHMCALLERTHPGWKVWRRPADDTCQIPVWCARPRSSPLDRAALISARAGILNQALTMLKQVTL